MKLSVIIPAYNEEKTIEEIVKMVFGVELPIKKEIIVVDDKSEDRTLEILRNLQPEFDFILIKNQKNLGKGGAVKAGLGKATGDFVIIQDADLEYDPKDYQKLLRPFLENNAQVVYGSRNLAGNRHGKLDFYLGGLGVTMAANLICGIKITDEPTCYKVFKKDLLDSLNLQANGFDFCPEVTAKIAKAGIRIFEVPISYNPRGKSEGKKIKWKDGFVAIWTLMKYSF